MLMGETKAGAKAELMGAGSVSPAPSRFFLLIAVHRMGSDDRW